MGAMVVKQEISAEVKRSFLFFGKHEQAFYGTKSEYSKKACLWIETQSRKLGRPIYHALSGNGGERVIKTKENKGHREIPVDGFDSVTNTVYQFHGCY